MCTMTITFLGRIGGNGSVCTTVAITTQCKKPKRLLYNFYLAYTNMSTFLCICSLLLGFRHIFRFTYNIFGFKALHDFALYIQGCCPVLTLLLPQVSQLNLKKKVSSEGTEFLLLSSKNLI